MAEYVNINTGTINKNVPTKETFDAARPKSVSVTLSATKWSNNSQTVNVPGVLADESKQLIIPIPRAASMNSNAYKKAGIQCTDQAANSLTFTCSSVPNINIDVFINIQEVIS